MHLASASFSETRHGFHQVAFMKRVIHAHSEVFSQIAFALEYTVAYRTSSHTPEAWAGVLAA